MIQKLVSVVPTPKNIFVDLNVILDVFLERAEFEASRDVIRLGEQAQHKLWISAHCVTTMAYLLERDKLSLTKIRLSLGWMFDTFNVVSTSEHLLREALSSQIKDFEDAVVEQAALKAGAQFILTRNIRDFQNSAIAAKTPEQYVLD